VLQGSVRKVKVLKLKNIHTMITVLVFLISLWSYPSTQNLLKQVSFGSLEDTWRDHKKTACEGQLISLSCSKDTMISIRQVIYEQDGLVCPPLYSYQLLPFNRNQGECSPNIQYANEIVSDLCSGRQDCTIMTGLAFNDSCHGIQRRLDVHYFCQPEHFLSKTVCSGENSKLFCENQRERISIFSGIISYENKENVCMHINDEQTINTKPLESCKDMEVTQVLSRNCHGYQSCFVSPSSLMFLADKSCSMKRGLLNITYTCVDEENFNTEYLQLTVGWHGEALAVEKYENDRTFKEIQNTKAVFPERKEETISEVSADEDKFENTENQNWEISEIEDDVKKINLSKKIDENYDISKEIHLVLTASSKKGNSSVRENYKTDTVISSSQENHISSTAVDTLIHIIFSFHLIVNTLQVEYYQVHGPLLNHGFMW